MSKAIKKLQKYGKELRIAGYILLFFFIATNTQTGWLYVLSALLAGLLTIGYLEPRLQIKNVTAKISPPVTSAKETASINIVVENNSSGTLKFISVKAQLPKGLELVKELSKEKPINTGENFLIEKLPPYSKAEFSIQVVCQKRGCWNLDDFTVSSGAPFGYFTTSKKLECTSLLIVHPYSPDNIRKGDYSANVASLENVTVEKKGAGDSLKGIRPYTFGEDIRLVHWPSTAKTDHLMVKEFLDTGKRDMVVLLDTNSLCLLGDSESSNLENAISCCAYLARLSQRNQISSKIILQHEGKLWLKKGEDREVLDLLAAVKDEKRLPWTDFFSLALDNVKAGDEVIILSVSDDLDLNEFTSLPKKVHLTAVFFTEYDKDTPDEYKETLPPRIEDFKESALYNSQFGRTIVHLPDRPLEELLFEVLR